MLPDKERSRPAGAAPDDQLAADPLQHKPAGTTHAATVYGTSPLKRNRRTNLQLAAIDDAILTAVAADQPVTLRGVYYRVVSAGAVDKTEQAYSLVGRQVLKLRRAGALPYSSITDGTRYVRKPKTHHDLDSMLENAAASYRRALWDDQYVDVHIFSEKDAIVGVIDRITASWDVPLGVLRGFASESFAWRVGDSVADTTWPVYLYQLGDHDPSGVDAWRDFERKVRGFAPAADLTFERIAVTPEQIVQWDLPTRPTKKSDTRSAGFVGESVEVDAIPAERLRTLVEAAITQHIDEDQFRLTTSVEQSERAILTSIVGGGAR